MKNYSTAHRLLEIMELKGLRQVDILRRAEPYSRALGVSLRKNDLSQYVSGKVLPGQDKLKLLGLALDVSEAWLMGYDVPMERNIAPTVENSERSDEFFEMFNQLSEEKQTIILSLMKELLGR